MKKNILISLLSASCLLLTACGVEYRLMTVDALRPAVNPVSFTGKNLAVFTSLYADGTPEQYVLRNDSLAITEVAVGMKEMFEKSVVLADYEVPIYNLYFYCMGDSCEHHIDNAYLQSITDETGSRLFIIIDSLWVNPYQGIERLFDMDYGYFYHGKTMVPFEITISLYDADKGEFISQKRFADTLEWGQSDYEQAKVMENIPSLSESVYLAAYEIGKRYANMMIPYWENIRRFYIVPGGSDWQTAADAAAIQDWTGAMSIWEKYTGSSDNKKASYAAFNMALGCEMQGLYDLAIEWLSYAKTKYYFGYINGYTELLEQRKSDSREIQWQLGE